MPTLDDAPAIAATATALLDTPPACLSFAPEDHTLLVVGTYSLHEATESAPSARTGTLELYRASGGTLAHVASHATPGGAVLDLKFSPHTPALLAVALSRGVVALYRLCGEELEATATIAVAAPDVLVLSLTWATAAEGVLGATLSDGSVAVVDVGAQAVTSAHTPHTLEAWTCEFARDGRTLYSGGDDAALVRWDLGAGVEVGRSRRGAHGAGVTSILDLGEGEVWSGSYDDVLRVWDVRGRVMKCEDEVGLGGGVWRLQEMGDTGRVLASCMHAGARVVEKKGLGIVAKWEENESMNYGGHVHKDVPNVVASCSFYDKKLCVWSI